MTRVGDRTAGMHAGHSSTDLPQVLAEIAEIVGREAALRLAIDRGGQQVFIPASVDADHWLAKLIGLDAAMALCAHFRIGSAEQTAQARFNGVYLLIPLAAQVRRNARLRMLIEQGLTDRQIIRMTGLHTRTISRHRARLRAEKRGLASNHVTSGMPALEGEK